MASNPTRLLTLACAGLLLAAPAAAQSDAFPSNQRLDAAIAAQELQHDADKAMQLFLSVARDESAPDTVRRHAWLRAAQLMPLLRNAADALTDDRRQALEQAARGDDPVAARARTLLEQDPADEARAKALHEKARQLVDAVATLSASPGKNYHNFGLRSDPTQDLLWIGTAAGPAVAEWLRAPRPPYRNAGDPEMANAGRGVLRAAWTLGGEQIERLLREALTNADLKIGIVGPYREPVPVRDLAIQALAITAADSWSTSLRDVTAAYLGSDALDARSRAISLRVLRAQMPTTLLLDEMTDPEFEVGQNARQAVFERALTLMQDIPRAETAQDRNALKAELATISGRVVAELTPLLDRPDPLLQRDVSQYLGLVTLSRRGRDWLLEKLPDLRLASFSSLTQRTRTVVNQGTATTMVQSGPDDSVVVRSLYPELEDAAAELAAWAARADEFARFEPGDPRRDAVASVVQMLSGASDRRSLDAVLTLASIELFPGLESWLEKQTDLTQGDVEKVLRRLLARPLVLRGLLPWVIEQDLSAGAFEPLQALDLENLEVNSSSKPLWLRSMLRTGDPRAAVPVRAFIQEIVDFPGVDEPSFAWSRFGDVFTDLLRVTASSRAPEFVQLLRDIQTAGVHGHGPWSGLGHWDAFSESAWLALVRLGDVEAVRNYPCGQGGHVFNLRNSSEWLTAVLPDGARLGERNQVNASLWALVQTIDLDGSRQTWHGYTPQAYAEAWRSLLSEISEERRPAWERLDDLLGQDAIDAALAKVVTDAWEGRLAEPSDVTGSEANGLRTLILRRDALPAELQSRITALWDRACVADHEAIRQVALECLPGDLDEISRDRAVFALADSSYSVAEAAMAALVADDQPITRAEVERALGAPSQGTVAAALRQLVPYCSQPTADLVAATALRNSHPTVRIAACNTLGALLDPAGVPGLLVALGDREQKVRDQARAALEAIRFHQEQRAHWDAVFDGTAELGSSKAAAKLVAQARPGQPKAQRLLAIRSLGVLGEPAALPFLIEWTTDDDAEIAAAATAAITQLHAKAGGR